MSIKKISHINWDTWEPTEKAVLCFVRNSGRIMLIHKKKGMGAGKINAPGGRIESGESAREASIRETMEETGIVPENPRKGAELFFQFTDGYSLHGSVFLADKFKGIMVNTPEADPFWCSEQEIPYNKMWADDILWLPGVLNGKKLKGFFIFEGDVMLDSKVEYSLQGKR